MKTVYYLKFACWGLLSLGLAVSSCDTAPELVEPKAPTVTSSSNVDLPEVIVRGNIDREPGGGSSNPPGGGGSTGTGGGSNSSGGGGGSGGSSTSAGTGSPLVPTIGDWSISGKINLNSLVRLNVVVEATSATHTLEKLTLYLTGAHPMTTLNQLGDGTNLGFNALDNTYNFIIRFQVVGLDGFSTSEQILTGKVNASTGSYHLTITRGN